MKKILLATGVLIGVFLVTAFIVVGYYFSVKNEFIGMDEDIKGKWAQVENQLKRRSDLIPNLVEVVKGYASHEKEIFEKIAESRSKLAGAGSIEDKIKASNEMTSALSRLLVVVENYPVLKADATFIRLSDELAGTENRISVERMRFNDGVKLYNTTVRQFPKSIIAGIAGFKERPYFEVGEAEKTAPKVDFKK